MQELKSEINIEIPQNPNVLDTVFAQYKRMQTKKYITILGFIVILGTILSSILFMLTGVINDMYESQKNNTSIHNGFYFCSDPIIDYCVYGIFGYNLLCVLIMHIMSTLYCKKVYSFLCRLVLVIGLFLYPLCLFWITRMIQDTCRPLFFQASLIFNIFTVYIPVCLGFLAYVE